MVTRSRRLLSKRAAMAGILQRAHSERDAVFHRFPWADDFTQREKYFRDDVFTPQSP
jgi:hypothetical protein